MNCEKIKKLIPAHLDKELQPNEDKEVVAHLVYCPACQRELKNYQNSWEILSQWKNIEPRADYVSQFWTELSLLTFAELIERKSRPLSMDKDDFFVPLVKRRSIRKSPWERFLEGGKNILSSKKLIPVYASLCVFLIVGVLSFKNYLSMQQSEAIIATLNEEELELIENIELAESLDLLEDLEFLEDLEIIEELDV